MVRIGGNNQAFNTIIHDNIIVAALVIDKYNKKRNEFGMELSRIVGSFS